MPVFLERFVLPILATIIIIVAVTNPLELKLKQRVIGTTGLLLLAAMTAYVVHRYNQRKPATAPSQTKRPNSTSERNYVDFKPSFLLGFFKAHTAIESQRIVAGYVGSWMRLFGRVRNVSKIREFGWLLTFEPTFLQIFLGGGNIEVFMRFTDTRWEARLTTLRRGDKVVVDGRIEKVDALSVYLDDCEFVG